MTPLPTARDLRPVPAEIRNAAIIYNPTSGRRRSRRVHALEEAQTILRADGIDAHLLPTTCAGSATELARSAVHGGCEMVVVCGGDGTINEVVNGIAGTDASLAVLPAGTANILAKELRIPWNIPAAARLIARGKLARIALGLAEWRTDRTGAPAIPVRRYFLCVSGAGPDGAIVHGINANFKLRAGILAYWLEAFRQFFTYRFPLFRIDSPENKLNASLVVVGRTKYYGGPFRITVGASLFEDKFEVVAYTGRNRFALLRCLPAIWLGRLDRVRGIHIWKTTHFSCLPVDPIDHTGSHDDCHIEIFSQIDGEPAAALPVEFSIVPNALTLVLPSNFKFDAPAEAR